jgi:ketol-acid reductoisomerase
MADLIKSISDGKFTHMDVNEMQNRHSDLEDRLGKTVDNPIFDSATEQYYKDIN